MKLFSFISIIDVKKLMYKKINENKSIQVNSQLVELIFKPKLYSFQACILKKQSIVSFPFEKINLSYFSLMFYSTCCMILTVVKLCY